MPGKRSYYDCGSSLSEAQLKRRARDDFYRTRRCGNRTTIGSSMAVPSIPELDLIRLTNEDFGLDEACPTTLCGLKGAATKMENHDLLQVHDPWKSACFPTGETSNAERVQDVCDDVWCNYLPVVPPPCDLSSDTPPFSPESEQIKFEPLLPPALPDGLWHSFGYVSSLESLVECQNNTIAMLCGQLDALRMLPTAGGARSTTSEPGVSVSCLNKNLRDLAASLPAAVEASIAKKLPAMIKPYLADITQAAQSTRSEVMTADASEMERHFAVLVRPHVVDVLRIVEDAMNSRVEMTVALVTKRVEGLFKEYDMLLQKQISNLANSVTCDPVALPTSCVDVNSIAPSGCTTDATSLPSIAGVFNIDEAQGSCCDRDIPPGQLAMDSVECMPSSRPCDSKNREMSIFDFVDAAKATRNRLPHIVELPEQLLMICDRQPQVSCHTNSTPGVFCSMCGLKRFSKCLCSDAVDSELETDDENPNKCNLRDVAAIDWQQ